MIINLLRRIVNRITNREQREINRSRLPRYFIICGLFLMVLSLLASLKLAFAFWYSPFLLGIIFILSAVNQLLFQNTFLSILYALMRKSPKYFLMTLVFFLVIVWWADYVYGQSIFQFWSYPQLDGVYRIVVPLFLHYPLGGVCMVESFYLFSYLVSGRHKGLAEITQLEAFTRRNLVRKSMGYVFLIVGLLAGLVPLVLKNYLAQDYFFIVTMVLALVAIMFVDSFNIFLTRTSVLLNLLEKDFNFIMAMVMASVLSFLFHEIPNTFSNEWIYQKISSGFDIFGVNVFIMLLGWPFLTLFSLTAALLLQNVLKRLSSR